MGNKKTVNAPYYNIGQLRMDLWNKLRSASMSLADAKEHLSPGKPYMEDCEKLIGQLANIEHHFAYPGMRRFLALKESFYRQEFVALTNTILDIRRELVSDSFRGAGEAETDQELDLQDKDQDRFDGSRQNYFEVLLVEDGTEADELALRKKIGGLQRESDKFKYGLVVQRSFQDALITLLFNPNIQAVVVLYAPPFEGEEIDPLISPYIQHALDLGTAKRKDEDLGPLLGQVVKQFRAEIDIYYVTDNVLPILKTAR
jgi:arginine decarboxylase